LAVYRTQLHQRAADCLDRQEGKLLNFLQELEVTTVTTDLVQSVDPDLRCLINCNTPDEYRRACQLAGVSGVPVGQDDAPPRQAGE
jgi:molybdopterin-guanine dinucleotide biosynthesis protein A